jgi:tetratricopeptide (TPR) repeat protein
LFTAVKTGGITISGLQGLGGVGKTALALKLAEQLKSAYPDAQFYLDLKGVTQPLSPRDAMAHVVHAYHSTAQLPENEKDLAPVYRSVLDGKRALLLMDNAHDAQQIAPLIPPPGCLLLVTSRKHFTLPGLVGKNLDKLPPADAHDLLLRIAPRLQQEKTEQVDELTLLCGYLPLALRAVGSALEVKKDISSANYANRLRETGKGLVLKEIDPLVQKSVGAALQSSYELLSDNLRQKFRFLSVFPDTFDLAAATAVWGILPDEAQDRLGDLLAYSLVEFDGISKRYSLHDLVRVFADQRLSVDERWVAQKLFSLHFVNVIASAEGLYWKGGESVKTALALLDVDWINIRTGHTWAVINSEDQEFAELSCLYPRNAPYCLDLRLHPQERLEWSQEWLSAARRLRRSDLEEGALLNLGTSYFRLSDYPHAIDALESCQKIALATGDRLGEASCWNNLGIVYRRKGEYQRALQCQEKHLQIAREIGNRRAEADATANIGHVYFSLGKVDLAVEYGCQHLDISRQTGDRRGQASALLNLGMAYHYLGEYDQSIEHHLASLEISRELTDKAGEEGALANIGLGYHGLGQYLRAADYLMQALDMARRISNRFEECTILGNLGNTYGALGDVRRSFDFQEQALKIAREIGNKDGEANALINGAIALFRLGDRVAAMVRAEAAVKIFETIEAPAAAVARDLLDRWRREDQAAAEGSAG